jgi:hypothetical protein
MHQNAGNEAIFVNFSGALQWAPYSRPKSRSLRSQVRQPKIMGLENFTADFRVMSSPKDLIKKNASANTEIRVNLGPNFYMLRQVGDSHILQIMKGIIKMITSLFSFLIRFDIITNLIL